MSKKLKAVGVWLANINVLRTLWTSVRDFVILLPMAFVFAFLADMTERFATMFSSHNWLTRVGNVFADLSGLCVAHVVVFILIAIGWPVVNKFGNFDFDEAWKNLPDWGKLTSYFGVCVGWFIGCAIVISG
jgi:hypothetical protein